MRLATVYAKYMYGTEEERIKHGIRLKLAPINPFISCLGKRTPG